MNRTIYNLVTLIVCLFLGGCNFNYETIKGSGKVISENRKTESFSAIELDISGDVYYSHSEESSIEVEAYANLLPYLLTTCEDGTLTISSKPNTAISSDKPIKIFLTGPQLEEIEVNGSGSVFTSGKITGEEFICDISGSGKVRMEHAAMNELNLEINGSGDVEILSGNFTEAEFEINGSGDINTSGVSIKEIDAEINGSGDMHLSASHKLDASISGSGDIVYNGNPKINFDRAGSGDLIKE